MSGKYSSDSPILKPEDDKFKRQPFSKRVADALANRSDHESIVVGIYGAWGQGKTSVLNLIDHQLKAHQTILVLRFNPWRYPSEDQLLVAFFEALAGLLGADLYTWIERKARSNVAKTVGKGAKSAPYGEGASEIIEYLSSVEVEKLKERIEEKLLEAKKRIVVLVDDIDRLDKSEVFAVFRLVKLTANLQYVSFVLAFDDEVVGDALQEHYAYTTKESGKAFLEKIIQIPLELPQVQQSLLRGYCLNGIERALTDSNTQLKEGQAASFVGAFDIGLMPVIQTPREAMRYENVLTFTLPILEGDLNVVDLMLLEGVRIFYPLVYDAMRMNKETFLAKRESFDNWETVKKRVLNKLDALLDKLPEAHRKPCSSLLDYLFPNLKAVRSNYQGNPDYKQANIDKRISSPRYYDRYFALTIPEGDISDTRIDRILALTNDPAVGADVVPSEIEQAIQDSSAEAVIFKLGLHDDKLSQQGIRTLCLAVSRVGDSIPQTTTFFSLGGPRRQAAWMLSNLLERIQNKDERIALAKELLIQAEPIAFGVEILYSIPTQKDDPTPDALTREEKLEIGLTMSDRFIRLAESGDLFNKSDDDISRIISAWNALGDNRALSAHLEKLVRGFPDFASRLVTILRPTVATMGMSVTSKGDLEFETYDWITKLVSADLLAQSIRQTHGEAAEPTHEWPMGRHGDDDDLRSAQQFLWRYRHNAKPPVAEVEVDP